MSKHRNIFFLMLMVVTWATGLLLCPQAHGQQGFLRYYQQPGADYGFDGVVPLLQGDFILPGTYGTSFHHSRNMRVNPFGEIVWVLDTMLLTYEYSWRTIGLGDTLFLEAGMSSANQLIMQDPYVHCYDANGNTRWAKHYSAYQYDQFTNLAVSDFGDIYPFGAFEDSAYHRQAFIIRLDIQGNEVWRREFRDTIHVMSSGIVALQDGGLLLSTVHYNWSDDYDAHLIRMDSSGNILFERTYQESWHEGPFRQMRLMQNGNILCEGNGNTIREFSPIGDFIQSYAVAESLFHAFPTADGGIILHGNFPGEGGFWVRKLKPDWTEQWYKTYPLPNQNTIVQVSEIPSGELIMAGAQGTHVFGSWIGLLIRTDCEGNIEDYSPCLPPPVSYTLYPNPNTGTATLSIPNEVASQSHTIQVFNALGQRVIETTVQKTTFLDLDLAPIEQGVYFLRVLENGKAVWNSRWLVQR